MKPVTIVGGGLAGLTLGIALRQRNLPTIVWEAGHYPRHRVCGEFISGQGVELLRARGLTDLLIQAGATNAETATFFTADGSSPVRRLDRPALCLSRFKLDAVLADEFRRQGGELREGQRWQGNSGLEGVVRATGRRLQTSDRGWIWFGLKVHAQGVDLDADLEMHALPYGYVGLCRLQNGVVNVCGLFRRRAGQAPASPKARELLKGRPGSTLAKRMAAAVLDEASFCAVAGLNLRVPRLGQGHECCLGDALTMIPPVTGNGMSMAIESAAAATEPLVAYSRGVLSWIEAQTSIAAQCDRIFKKRLAWAVWLQRMMLWPPLQGRLATIALRSDWLWRVMFSHTR
jgi:2-polyprenyl-6-methoxyphenol hydroxylase-like FAD-dependent oxidoreductase